MRKVIEHLLHCNSGSIGVYITTTNQSGTVLKPKMAHDAVTTLQLQGAVSAFYTIIHQAWVWNRERKGRSVFEIVYCIAGTAVLIKHRRFVYR